MCDLGLGTDESLTESGIPFGQCVCVCKCFYYFLHFSFFDCRLPAAAGLDNNVANSCFDLTAFRCHLFHSSLPWALSPPLSLARDKSTIFPFSLCCSCLLEKKGQRERETGDPFFMKMARNSGSSSKTIIKAVTALL